MERAELLNSQGYWTAKIQTELYRELTSFMEKTGMNSTQLAIHLGCSKGYVSQLLNGDFDHKISKLVELSLAMGKIPVIEFKDAADFTAEKSQPASSEKKMQHISPRRHTSRKLTEQSLAV